jgi:O-methyltransferase
MKIDPAKILRFAKHRLRTAANEMRKTPLHGAIRIVRPYTMGESDALNNLHRLGRHIAQSGLPGDHVECGTFHGGSAAAAAIGFGPGTRTMWLYDSFEGLPEPKAIDGPDAAQWTGGCVGAIEKLNDILTKINVPENRICIRKGWFQDTFVEPLPEKIALLHIDADWYDSVALALDTFYDRVVEGGVIVLDDFGYWEGCRVAFYDFCIKKKIKPLIERCGIAQAWWIKGKDNNR